MTTETFPDRWLVGKTKEGLLDMKTELRRALGLRSMSQEAFAGYFLKHKDAIRDLIVKLESEEKRNGKKQDRRGRGNRQIPTG